MTYDEMLAKYIKKLGRDITAGEVVHDLRQMKTHGYWVLVDKDHDMEELRCSVCGQNYILAYRWRYCPECGSEMSDKNDHRVRFKTDETFSEVMQELRRD